MRSKEFIVVFAIIVAGYSIMFLVNIYFEFARYCMLLMNWALIFFYCLFLSKKLPQDYYKYNSIDRCTQYSIFFAIFFLFTCSLWFFTGEYNKIILKITQTHCCKDKTIWAKHVLSGRLLGRS